MRAPGPAASSSPPPPSSSLLPPLLLPPLLLPPGPLHPPISKTAVWPSAVPSAALAPPPLPSALAIDSASPSPLHSPCSYSPVPFMPPWTHYGTARRPCSLVLRHAPDFPKLDPLVTPRVTLLEYTVPDPSRKHPGSDEPLRWEDLHVTVPLHRGAACGDASTGSGGGGKASCDQSGRAARCGARAPYVCCSSPSPAPTPAAK